MKSFVVFLFSLHLPVFCVFVCAGGSLSNTSVVLIAFGVVINLAIVMIIAVTILIYNKIKSSKTTHRTSSHPNILNRRRRRKKENIYVATCF